MSLKRAPSRIGAESPTEAAARMTSLVWLNPAGETLLLCGSDDGVARVWAGLLDHIAGDVEPARISEDARGGGGSASENAPRLVTSFFAAPDLVAGQRGSGLVTAWQQRSSTLIAGGNSTVLRMWSLHSERCVTAWPTHSESCVTALATPGDESDDAAAAGGRGARASGSSMSRPPALAAAGLSELVLAGFGDGSMRLYDRRVRNAEGLPNHLCGVYSEHTSWLVHAHLSGYELTSGCVSGQIKFWDLRFQQSSIRTIEAQSSTMTALATHPNAPLLASGSHNQFIKVMTRDGEQLSVIRYHDGFLGQRIGPVSCLAFHPNQLLLAAGATDSIVAVYNTDH